MCTVFKRNGVAAFRLQKLASIPMSAFYSKAHKHLAGNRIRFCFFKVRTIVSYSK